MNAKASQMIDIENWTDLEISDGRYKVLELIGEGSMGVVYLAHDLRLKCEVVIKCPRIPEASVEGPETLERFDREIRSLVNLSHPHIVRISDVGSFEGSPFVVMQYLSGGTLKDRMEHDSRSGPRPMAPHTLRDWLIDVAKALDFIHGQNYIHRDVKPANILFDRFGNTFLSDFGIIKALAHEAEAQAQSQLTAPGSLLGTPNYVAPEIIMGLACDGRADQYSLAMTVHEVLMGSNCMEGPTPSATLVNQTTVEPPALIDVVRGIPEGLSHAVQRALSKDPRDRFDDCLEFATEVLANLPTSSAPPTAPIAGVAQESRGKPGDVHCPACQAPLELGREHAGERVRCPRCEGVAFVQVSKNDTLILNQVTPPSRAWAHKPLGPGGVLPSGSSSGWTPRPSRTTKGGTGPSGRPAAPRKRGWESARWWGAYAVLALICVGAALSIRRELLHEAQVDSHRLAAKPPRGGDFHDEAADTAGPDGAPPSVPPAKDVVEINIAYGTEKEKWLKDALREFEKTEPGRRSRVHLIGMGSLEGAEAVLRGTEGAGQKPIHVWSPASSVARDMLETSWLKHAKGSPILRAENLALTPMVFLMWKNRYDAFIKKYKQVDFKTLAQAMGERDGWAAIAQKPEWGYFKFGHTAPQLSNSGLLAIVLTAYENANKVRGLTVQDVTGPPFLSWLHRFETEVTPQGQKLNHSTGTLMKEMVLRGPSQFDCLVVYENLAIEYMEPALEHWGEAGRLYVSYPDPNIWNEHPYYVLNVPWSDSRQREAANEFLDFLMSEPIQRKALEHGFRPANPAVPIRQPNSPLVRNEESGVRIDVPAICEPPRAAVVRELLHWFEEHPR
ncbi:MAG: substrate-binding domain-containing protein [Isosphaeraceae bacterium]|nr:substrate-binding domain-containing protein [Isosphaeraceae bacterium]